MDFNYESLRNILFHVSIKERQILCLCSQCQSKNINTLVFISTLDIFKIYFGEQRIFIKE